jgi:hypothetical protein
MKVLLRNAAGSSTVYWVKRTATSVVGWFDGGWLAPFLDLPPSATVDTHFTYPADGDLHFSLKWRDAVLEEEGYVTVRTDSVRRKRINLRTQTRDEVMLPRDGDLFGHLMPRSRPAPLAQYSRQQMLYQFPALGLSVTGGTSSIQSAGVVAVESMEAGPGDVVVDLTQLPPGNLSVAGFLTSAGLAGRRWPAGGEVFSRCDKSAVPWLEVSAWFEPRSA